MKMRRIGRQAILVLVLLMLTGCADSYYGALEKVGIHKRDIMVDRVEKARDAQLEAQEQFQSALDQFSALIKLEESDLKKAYDKLNSEYEQSKEIAEDVSDRIEKVESVAEDLFTEWQDELDLYQNQELKRDSSRKLKKTRARYQTMLASMHQAEKSMAPVLRIFRDNVLYLKHNLNAQAIGSIQGEFSKLRGQIDRLVANMNLAIKDSNAFIADMQ